MTTWDTNVALAFAAEELLCAAQAVTSDSLSQEQRFGLAHSHVQLVSENRRSLPPDIADGIEVLDAGYSNHGTCGATDTASAMALVASTLNLLGDVPNRLLESQGTKTRAS